MNKDILIDYKLESYKKDKNVYIVSGFICMDDLLSILYDTRIFTDKITTYSQIKTHANDDTASVLIHFDKKTLRPVFYDIQFESNTPATQGTLEKFSITIDVNDFVTINNADTEHTYINIPDEVYN